MQKLFYIKITLILLFSFNAISQNKKYVKMGVSTLTINNEPLLVANFENTPKWHTYWKNPGDAGLPIKVSFFIDNEEIKLKEKNWPTPKRYIEQGNMWAYGYGGKYSLFFELEPKYRDKEVKVIGEWLVCKDICIPGKVETSLKINEKFIGKTDNVFSPKLITKQFNNLPINSKEESINFFVSIGRNPKELALSYVIEDVKKELINEKTNIVTPFPLSPLTYKHEEIHIDKKNRTLYGRIYIDWDGEYEDPVWELPKDGIFKESLKAKFLFNYPKNKNSRIINYKIKQFSITGDKALTKTFESFSQNSSNDQKEKNSIFYFIFFAFLGGLILNLMPCVLPVISLKLFGLIAHSDESKSKILKHNLSYTLGVVFTFLILATVVLMLKISGDQIGWGFQLQSPIFVFIMLLVIFIMALNMFGLFEFITPGGKKLGNAQLKEGFIADFVNGILATILSTPCSAPFLGTALTFAFTTSNINIFLIFLSVGIGLSFPFILTGIFPSLIKFLPKPGMWMDKLKKILGLSLLLTSVWLLDVLFALIDSSLYGIYINTIIVLVFFVFYFWKYISKNRLIFIIILFLPISLLYKSFKMGAFEVVESENISSNKVWKKWSLEKMNKSKGTTFINFTASWCLTCKVNKKLVLETEEFRDLVKVHNISLLEGDWTKRDEEITTFLRSHNIVGVPAYFIKMPDGEIISLGETITINKIKSELTSQ